MAHCRATAVWPFRAARNRATWSDHRGALGKAVAFIVMAMVTAAIGQSPTRNVIERSASRLRGEARLLASGPPVETTRCCQEWRSFFCEGKRIVPSARMAARADGALARPIDPEAGVTGQEASRGEDAVSSPVVVEGLVHFREVDVIEPRRRDRPPQSQARRPHPTCHAKSCEPHASGSSTLAHR